MSKEMMPMIVRRKRLVGVVGVLLVVGERGYSGGLTDGWRGEWKKAKGGNWEGARRGCPW